MRLRLAQFAFALSLLLAMRAVVLAQPSQQMQHGYVPASAVQLKPDGQPAAPPEAVPPPPGGQPVGDNAQPGAPLTLEQASELALRTNPVLAKAWAAVDSKIGVAWQAGIPPNPRYDSNNPQVFAGAQSQYNVGFMQELPVKGKLRLDQAAANQDVSQARFAYIRERFTLLTAVRQQFYHVLAQERRVEVLTELEQIASRSHGVAQQRVVGGRVAESDVVLLYTDLLQAQIAVTNARTQLEGARRALAATIGIPELLIKDAIGDLRAGLPEFDEELTRQFVANENATVREAQLQISQNRILLQRARVEPYPNPYVGPAVAWGPTSSSSNGWGSQLWINLQMNIPVWNLNQGNIRSADANVRDAVASVGVVRNDLLRRTADTLALYRAARERAQYIAQFILPAAERGQELVLSAYEVGGAKDVSTVLQAQRALIQARLDFIDALENAWSAAAELAGLLQIERFP